MKGLLAGMFGGDEIDSDVEIFPSVDLMSEEDLIKYVGVDDD